MNRILCLLLGLGMAATVPARAQVPAQTPGPVPIEAKLTSETKKLNRERLRPGAFRETFEITFTAELRNTSPKDSLDPIHLRLVPFFVPAGQTTPAWELFPNRLQTRDNLTLTPGQTLSVKFDAIPFDNGQQTIDTPNGKSKQFIGIEYAGSALEVYRGSQFVSVAIEGDASVRKAYEKWAEMQAVFQARMQADRMSHPSTP